jgi:acyl carrier protein
MVSIRLAESATDEELAKRFSDVSGEIEHGERSSTEESGVATLAGASLYSRPDVTNDFVAPQTQTERTLARIWQQVLGIKHVGIHDNFFELGGDSLMAVSLLSEIERVLGQRLPPASLIDVPTIHQLADFIHEERASLQKRRKLLDTTSIAQPVRSFIVENYLPGQDHDLKDSDSFLEHGIINETGVLQLVAFLEETFGITVKDEELTPDNLGSIDIVSGYVFRKLDGTMQVDVPAVQKSVAGENA